jgi:hypothetical protein
LKSKKRSKITNGKWQLDEPPFFFLDRTWGRNELAAILRAEDFILTTIYEEFGDAESRMNDPVIIHDCGLKNRVLLTGDQDMVYTYAKEIAEASIAVFVVTNNNENPKQWGPRIIKGLKDICRELRRRRKPFTARISKEGTVTQVRLYDGTQWKAITIGKKNAPHASKYKPKAEPESS